MWGIWTRRAGVAGIIKSTLLALAAQGAEIPQTLQLRVSRTPRSTSTRSPFYVNTELKPWDLRQRLAAPLPASARSVMGGTNAHVGPRRRRRRARARLVLGVKFASSSLLSARGTPTALCRPPPSSLAEHLEMPDDAELTEELCVADVAFTHAGRTQASFAAATRGHLPSPPRTAPTPQRPCAPPTRAALVASGSRGARRIARVAFLFTGQGAQYAEHGSRDLYAARARLPRRSSTDVLRHCLTPHVGHDLRALATTRRLSNEDRGRRPSSTSARSYTQPALFAVEYALAASCSRSGVASSRPAMLGHSDGRVRGRLHLAGVLSLADALAARRHAGTR